MPSTCRAFISISADASERVVDFAQRLDNGEFILVQQLLGARYLDLDLALAFARVENWAEEIRADAPDLRIAVEQIGDVISSEPQTAGQAQRRPA